MRELAIVFGLVTGAFYIMLFQSCDYGYLEPVEVVIPDTVSFAADVQPIFTESCTGADCHIAGGVAPNLTVENAYWDLWLYGMVDTTDPESSIVYNRMASSSNPMPPNGILGEDKIQLVLVWIEQGARDN